MNRMRKPIIERNYRTMLSAYKEAGRDFLRRLDRFGMQVATDGDIQTADVAEIGKAYKQIYQDTVIQFAKYGRSQLKRKKAGEDDRVYERWIADIEQITAETTGLFINTIQQTSKDEIQRIIGAIIQDGIDQGYGIETIAETIGEKFAKEWGLSTKWMARRIAQTETIRASNFGTKYGVDSLGIDYVQSWLCRHDNRERETHLTAAKVNHKIPKDQLFWVGGHECKYPGDPDLPPRESINCRCSWTAEPVD